MQADSRERSLSLPWRAILVATTIVGVGIAVYYLFNLSFAGGVLMDVASRYLVAAFFLPFAFILFSSKGKGGRGVPWFDVLAAVFAFAILFYLFLHSSEIMFLGWTTPPSLFHAVLGLVLCLLVLEAGRRTGGIAYCLVCVAVGVFPLFAAYMPGPFEGTSLHWSRLIGLLAFNELGLIGLPSAVIVNILVGFLVFAGILIASGGGKFFLDLATVILGRFRGGPAKVAVLGSGLFGSISGSAIANVVGTGSVTIPAMKRLGFEPHYAAAIEACASTGGMFMPPIMGTAAFIMAELLGMPYATIIVCAALPAILFYLGLLVQVDFHAATSGVKGVPAEEIPSIREVMKGGWHFIIAFLFLVWGLLYMRWEAMTPYYASALLILLSMVRKETRLTPGRLMDVVERVGRLVIQTVAILLPLAFVIGGLAATGAAPAFASGVVSLAGGNPYLVLLFGVAVCYILGMMGMVAPAYIFLAVTMAPTIVGMGFDEVAVHLFIIYYAMMGAITPPVAIAAFVAAGIAGASGMRTALLATKLGIVIYFVPFFFVFNPALVLRGPPLETIYFFGGCALGIVLIAGGLVGYLWRLGKISIWARPLLIIAGFLLGFPEWRTDVVGIIIAVLVLLIMFVISRPRWSKKVIEGSERSPS